jgi:DNA polymerase
MLAIARQLVEAETLLGGDLMPSHRNPLPPIEPAPAQAPAPADDSPQSLDQPPRASGASSKPNAVAAAIAAAGTAAPPRQLDELPEAPEAKQAALDALRERIADCSQCVLGTTRTNLVFGEGSPSAELMFIGEAPGADEDASGRPFVGRAGELLTKMIRAMGLERDDVYIANILKCRPPNNRTPNPQEMACCWPALLEQMQIIRPKVIVTLGNPATQTLLNTREGITRLRGQWQQLPDLAPGLGATAVMPTFHPAYLLRNYSVDARGKVWEDLQKVMEKLGLDPPAKKHPADQ